MAIKQRDHGKSGPMANTVTSKQKILASEPADAKPKPIKTTGKEKDPPKVAKATKPVANMMGNKKNVEEKDKMATNAKQKNPRRGSVE